MSVTIFQMNRRIAKKGIKGGHFNNSGMVEFHAISEGAVIPKPITVRSLWSIDIEDVDAMFG